jgi:hypothetical protein
MTQPSNKFESLLELLINEENDKAEQMFHEIVVEKSRDIYENLASTETKEESVEETKEDTKDEVKETESTEEKVEETSEEKVEETSEESKDETVEETAEEKADESATTEEESIEEVGGDATDDLIKDISSDQEGDAEASADDMGADMDAGAEEGDTEERVADLEDALEDLKAEFEKMMGDEDKGEDAPEENIAPALTPEIGMESKEAKETVKEYKDTKTADNADHADVKSSPVASNAKAPTGASAHKIGGAEESGRPAPTAKSMNATTEPKQKEVKADHKDGTDASSKKSPVVAAKK